MVTDRTLKLLQAVARTRDQTLTWKRPVATMPDWLHLTFVLFLHISTLISPCAGSIQCICTTAECISEGKTSCTSEHMCYVQNMPGDVASNPGLKRGIVRGCIDERTPLLCENRKPQVYTGPWPVLHCCKQEWCNKDVVPTVPTPWLEQMKKNAQRNSGGQGDKLPLDSGLPYPRQNDQAAQRDSDPFDSENRPLSDQPSSKKAHIYKPRQQSRRKTINPLYIAVPVAGACVLLAIIIFAIYILKRQNALMAEYHQQHLKQNQKLCPIYHGNLKLQHPHHILAQQQQKLMQQHHMQQQQQQCAAAPTTKDLMCSAQSNKQRQYSDCSSERSSTGSETKLLMKV